MKIPRLVCEVNTNPNNENSHKFHIKNSFKTYRGYGL